MKIRVIDRDGNKHELEGDPNSTLMEILRDADLDIEAACGGCCACATCHVYINDQWLEKISPIDDDEENKNFEIDYLLPFFGLKMELGPIAKWGLNLDNN